MYYQNFIKLIKFGDVAQLARALDWQSRGRGFESLLLHKLNFLQK